MQETDGYYHCLSSSDCQVYQR